MRIYRVLASTLLLAAFPAFAQTPDAPEPALNPDHTVSFRLKFPNAQKVQLALENHKTAPMVQNAAGLWTITTEALDPEYYSYHFIVDGTSVLDPLNPKLVESYTSAGNVLLVPAIAEGGAEGKTGGTSGVMPHPAAPGPWERTAVPHGVVHHHTFTSSFVRGLSGNQSEYYVYTPPGYDPRSATKYPVLYLLHGWSDTAAGWTNIGHADNIVDNLIAQGKARPMIVVMPLGYGNMSFLHTGFNVWQDAAAIDNNTALFTQTLLTEVLPQVEKLYNVSAKREDRAITGLSMGGLEGLTVGLNHTDKFAWVGGFSAALHMIPTNAYDAFDPKKANLKYLFISVGMNDGLLEPDRAYAAGLRARGFDVTTVETPGNAHVWQQWRADLVTFASHIFQAK